MAGFERIAVGWDAFERDAAFVDRIRDLGRDHDAHIELIHVVSGPTHHAWFGADDDPWDQVVARDRARRLEEVAERLRDDGLSVHCSVPIGLPHVELIRQAERSGCDLLFIIDEPGPRGESRSFGAVTKKLLRKSALPVWAARLDGPSHPRRIVAALDVMPSGEHAEQPNARILDACRRLARNPVQVTLVHVWNIWAEELLRGRMNDRDFQHVVHNAQHEHEAHLDRWRIAFEEAGLNPTVRIAKGEARVVLPHIVEDLHPDLVVMGTLCRTGLPGLIIGNTAERILNRLSCSVLTVKPEGFVSPVPVH